MSKIIQRSSKQPEQHPVATTLRERGFVPMPRLWIKATDLPTIHELAAQYRDEVLEVRAQCAAKAAEQREKQAPAVVEPKTDPDPRTDREAAWEALERLRKAG